MSEHAVYRFFDKKDELLYVGCSINPFSRFESHRDKRRDMVRYVEIEWFETQTLAEAAEAVAIRREKPLWNKVKPKRALRITPTYLGKHFGYSPVGYASGFQGVDHWFSTEDCDFARVMKQCRAGDVIHLHPDVDVSNDDKIHLAKNCVHVWHHPASDFESKEQG